jgi:hypothetical protein
MSFELRTTGFERCLTELDADYPALARTVCCWVFVDVCNMSYVGLYGVRVSERTVFVMSMHVDWMDASLVVRIDSVRFISFRNQFIPTPFRPSHTLH